MDYFSLSAFKMLVLSLDSLIIMCIGQISLSLYSSWGSLSFLSLQISIFEIKFQPLFLQIFCLLFFLFSFWDFPCVHVAMFIGISQVSEAMITFHFSPFSPQDQELTYPHTHWFFCLLRSKIESLQSSYCNFQIQNFHLLLKILSLFSLQ